MSSEPLLSFVVSHLKYEDFRHLGTTSNGKVTKTINAERSKLAAKKTSGTIVNNKRRKRLFYIPQTRRGCH